MDSLYNPQLLARKPPPQIAVTAHVFQGLEGARIFGHVLLGFPFMTMTGF